MKNDVILKKMSSLQRCLDRLEEKRPERWEALLEDIDLQDIISVNLERAVQLIVDIGLQALAELGVQSPETMGEVFTSLQKEAVLSLELAARLKGAVGFRNIAVHEYEEIDWSIVHAILVKHLDDFSQFMKRILEN
jgi:uncharacterized protein YutE (UPF0331/DUF86 family)